MANSFYYLVPKDYDNPENLKNEYFIIKELLKKGIKIIPIYEFKEIVNDFKYDGIIFNSLKVILSNQQILIHAKKNKVLKLIPKRNLDLPEK